MDFSVKLDCKPENQAELLKHQSASLAAFKLFGDYSVATGHILGIGPELYAEQWIHTCLAPPDRDFEDLVMTYFIKILRAVRDNE